MKNISKILIPILCLFILTGCPSGSSYESSYDSNGFSGGMMASASDMDSFHEEAKLENQSQYVDIESYDPETNTFAGKKIIYSGDASLETKNYKEDLQALEKLIADNKIMITDSYEEDYDNYWYSTHNKYVGSYGKIKRWTLRVPVENFDKFVNALDETSAHISSKNVRSNDVTKQYNDNDTKIKALEVQRDRLIELLSQAQNVTEILEIEDRLTQVRYQLESLNNSNTQIDFDVKYSEFSLTLREVNRYSTDTYSFWERFIDSFGESWSNFTEWLGDLVIWFVFALPFIVLFAGLICLINFIRVKKGKQKLSLKNLFNGIISDGKAGNILKVVILLVGLLILYSFLRSIF